MATDYHTVFCVLAKMPNTGGDATASPIAVGVALQQPILVREPSFGFLLFGNLLVWVPSSLEPSSLGSNCVNGFAPLQMHMLLAQGMFGPHNNLAMKQIIEKCRLNLSSHMR